MVSYRNCTCFELESNSGHLGFQLSTFYYFPFFRRIAGLTDKKAKAIIAWRDENGAFTNREQLKSIKGIGLKSYEQCVGFVRIVNSVRLNSNVSKPTTSGLNSTADNDSAKTVVVLDSDEEEDVVQRGKKRKGVGAEGGVKKKKKKHETLEFSVNPLDMTWIHPESYPVANR